MLKIAVQKSGRLHVGSVELLSNCGLKFNAGKGQLITPIRNFDAQILYLRDDDIPKYVEDGVAHLGIIGENVLLEKECKINVVRKLGFSKCRVSLAVPKNQTYNGVEFFEGKKIATSYPKILRSFLKERKINAGIHSISGSVEIAPGIGLSDAVMDIVSTGSTLLTNGLKEVETVFISEAVLISNRDLDTEAKQLSDQLLFRIKSVLTARDSKYILLNAPNDRVDQIIKILPGMKSPTVLPLAESGWSSIHSVVSESKFWEIIEKLKNLGAEGILVVPIEKMVI